MRRYAGPDPFALEPATAMYVPRQATVDAQNELELAIQSEDPLIVFCGPPGIGKSLLLRLLRRTVEGRMLCAELRGTGRGLEDLCAAALQALGAPDSRQPAEDLLRLAGEARASGTHAGLLLLVDDADELSPETLRALLALCARSGSVQAVVVRSRVDEQIDPRMSRVVLDAPMRRREVFEYVRARLAMAVAPDETRRRFGAWTVWRLARASGGNPRRLHELTREILRPQAAPAPAPVAPVPAPERSLALWAGGALGVLLLLGALWLGLRGGAGAPEAGVAAETASAPAPPVREPETAAAPASPPRALPEEVEAVDAPPPARARREPAPVLPPATAPGRADGEPPAAIAGTVLPQPAPAPLPLAEPEPVAQPEPVPVAKPQPRPVPEAVPLAEPAPAPPPEETPVARAPAPAPAPVPEAELADPAPAPAGDAPPAADPAPVEAPAPVPVAGPDPAPAPALEPSPVAEPIEPPEPPRERLAESPAPDPAIDVAAAAPGPGVELAGFRVVEVRSTRPGRVPGPEAGRVPVFINAVPAAEIEIDGHEIGSTPIVALPVPPGERSFVAIFANGTRLERRVEVDGEEVHVLFP